MFGIGLNSLRLIIQVLLTILCSLVFIRRF